MGRVLSILTSGLLYFCLATVLAEALLIAYFGQVWHVDRARLIQTLAAAQGIARPGPRSKTAAEPVGAALSEQPSFEQFVEARALKLRDFELRQQALKNDSEQLRVERGKLTEEKLAFEKTRADFEVRVAAEKKRQSDAGWEENRRALLAAKPKQAKELIAQMLDKNEMDEVVALMRPMTDLRRAKIFAEFKSAEEIKKVDEILRLIRRGDPVTSAADKVQQQLGSANLPTAPGGQ